MSDGMTDGARDRRGALASDRGTVECFACRQQVPIDRHGMSARCACGAILMLGTDGLPTSMILPGAAVVCNEPDDPERMIADLASALAREHDSVVKHANRKPCATCELLRRAFDRNQED